MYPWDIDCSHGRALKEELGIQFILKRGSAYEGSPEKVIINWGSSAPAAHTRGSRWINDPAAVATSVNKIATFRAMERAGVNHVPYTCNPAKAMEWLLEGHKVVCRDTVEGREGAGLRIIDATALNLPVQGVPGFLGRVAAWLTNASQWPSTGLLGASPLFTRFVPSTREYRVHVVNGVAINVRRKAEEDFYNVTIYPQEVATQAIAATRAVGLDFAGVDILWDNAMAWVLETNTAPGIGGLTVGRYASALRDLIRERHGIDF